MPHDVQAGSRTIATGAVSGCNVSPDDTRGPSDAVFRPFVRASGSPLNGAIVRELLLALLFAALLPVPVRSAPGEATGEQVGPRRSVTSESSEVSGSRRIGTYNPLHSCSLPEVPEGAQVVFVGTRYAEALSTVTVVGQDRITGAGRLIVEDGAASLYVVAASAAGMIWTIEGSVGRISRFVGIAPDGHAGLTGLPADKVSWRNCPHLSGDHWLPENTLRAPFQEALSTRFKGQVPIFIGVRQLVTVHVPSGRHEAGRRANAGSPSGNLTETQFKRFYPGGLRQIDPRAVVSPVEVAAYEVLPSLAGLLQLSREGRVKVISDGSYKIVKRIPRFPAGLTAALSVKWLLAEGVPIPAGDPLQSPVFSEKTRECVAGALCRMSRDLKQ